MFWAAGKPPPVPDVPKTEEKPTGPAPSIYSYFSQPPASSMPSDWTRPAKSLEEYEAMVLETLIKIATTPTVV